MLFQTLNGSTKRVTRANKYIIDWNKPSRSKIQYTAKQFLKDYWKNHVVFEEFPVAGTRLKFDFYNANKKIAIEVNGQQHVKYVPFFHKRRSNFVSQIRRDQQKIDFCELNKIKLVEIYSESELDKKKFEELGIYL
jgi:very-short-patch-repair endonuclease